MRGRVSIPAVAFFVSVFALSLFLSLFLLAYNNRTRGVRSRACNEVRHNYVSQGVESRGEKDEEGTNKKMKKSGKGESTVG